MREPPVSMGAHCPDLGSRCECRSVGVVQGSARGGKQVRWSMGFYTTGERRRGDEQIITEPGAHTTAFDVQRQRLYVFLPSCRVAVYEESEVS